MSACPFVDKNIENTNNQLKYLVIHSKNGSITTFELLFNPLTPFSHAHSKPVPNPLGSVKLLLNAVLTPRIDQVPRLRRRPKLSSFRHNYCSHVKYGCAPTNRFKIQLRTRFSNRFWIRVKTIITGFRTG